jgi:glyoxylate reductase
LTIIGDIVWAHDEVKELFSGLAEVLVMDCKSRPDFVKELASGGRFAGIVGVYRHNISADHVGM